MELRIVRIQSDSHFPAYALSMYLTNLGHSILTNLTLSLILEIIYPLSAQVQASRVQAGTGACRGLIFVALSR